MLAHHNTSTAGDGARRRRPLLLSLAVLGAVTGLLGGLGVFADAFDRSTTGPNSYEAGEYVELDLQLAHYDIAEATCGEYSDDLVSGLFAITDDELDGSTYTEGLCVRNVGERAGELHAGVIDLADTEVGCTGGESIDDASCGTGEGELSSALLLSYTDCVSSTHGQSGLAGGPIPLFFLTPGEELQLCPEVSLTDTEPSTLRSAQSDRAEWRYAFDLSATDGPPPCEDDEWEPNDFTPEAAFIPFDVATPAVLCPESSRDDWFGFQHSGGPLRVDLDFEVPEGDLGLRLLSAGNGWLPTTSSGGKTIEVANGPAGSYVILVEGLGLVEPVDYVLTVTASPSCIEDPHEPNDVRSAATNISVGAPVSGARCADDDWFSYFKMPGSPDTHVRLDFDHDDGDLELDLYDAAGALVSSSETEYDYESIVFSGQGAFYFLVRGYRDADNPAYTLTLTARPTG